MTTHIIPQYFGNPPSGRTSQTPESNADPEAAFNEMLRQSLDQENRGLQSSEVSRANSEDMIPNLNESHYQTSADLDESTLDILSGTKDFNSLGVLILRTVNLTREALTSSEQSQLIEQKEPVLSPLKENDGLVSNDSHVDETGFHISNPINAIMRGSASSASKNFGVALNKVSSTKLVASAPEAIRNTPLLSLLNQRVSMPPKIDAEATKASVINAVENFAEAQNIDIEVSVIRGELGLIIQVSTPSMSTRLLRALEQRLTQLVEQSGEKVERIEFNSSDMQTPNPIYSVLERATNGSD